MTVLNTQNTLLKILQENPPLFSGQIYQLYSERAQHLTTSKVNVRKHLESMMQAGFIHRGDEYIKGKGYLYTIASKPTPVASASSDEVIFGEVSSSAKDLLKFLYTTHDHPFLSQENWDGLRYNLILLLLDASSPLFKAQLTQLRDSMVRTLGQLNTIIDGDLWSEAKRAHTKASIPNSDAVLLLINQYLNGEINELPEW